MYLTERFRAKLQKQVKKARIEGKVEVYQEIAAWNRRRLEAEAKGLPFDEQPPTNSHDDVE